MIVVLPAADRDLDSQAEYLGERASPEVALRFYGATAETFSVLARNPEMGTLRETKNPALGGIRSVPVAGFEKHLVFYRPTEDGIEVVRVLHGHRDIGNIL